MLIPQISQAPFGRIAVCLASLLAAGAGQAVAEEFTQEMQGNLGVAGYYTRSIIAGKSDATTLLPYLDFNYGRTFARVDTLGIKTLPIGYGHLELIGRISLDGFSTDAPELQGLAARATPIPLGVGTLQVTPLGGFWINAFHDVNKSKGNRFELIWGGKLELPRVTIYPLLGAEYLSQDYVRYYYGISAQEAAGSQYAAYQPAGASNGFIGLIADIKLTDEYFLNCYVRRKWLADAIQLSPIVTQRYLDTAYVALSYRFK